MRRCIRRHWAQSSAPATRRGTHSSHKPHSLSRVSSQSHTPGLPPARRRDSPFLGGKTVGHSTDYAPRDWLIDLRQVSVGTCAGASDTDLVERLSAGQGKQSPLMQSLVRSGCCVNDLAPRACYLAPRNWELSRLHVSCRCGTDVAASRYGPAAGCCRAAWCCGRCRRHSRRDCGGSAVPCCGDADVAPGGDRSFSGGADGRRSAGRQREVGVQGQADTDEPGSTATDAGPRICCVDVDDCAYDQCHCTRSAQSNTCIHQCLHALIIPSVCSSGHKDRSIARA